MVCVGSFGTLRHTYQRNLEAIRFIASAILIVQHPRIQNSTHERLELKVQLGESGEVHFKDPTSDETLFISDATDVIAYRSAHLCWSEPNGEQLSIRIDDTRFSACPLDFRKALPKAGHVAESLFQTVLNRVKA